MSKLILDGQELDVAPGTTILQAALSRGIEIPHYCFHPGLSIAGNCRMCLVEVEKAPKLMIACSTQVSDGMVVHTDTEKVRNARAAMMEFFLLNHPLDCPICDQAGECKLQDFAVEYGTGKSRYVEEKRHELKAVELGPHVLLDQERCIRCSRCIRFCNEITGTGELAFFERGERAVIGTFPGRPLDNPYSGNVVDLCPVGALTLKEFRFRSRVWFLENTPSVCAGCARGCNVVVGVARQRELMGVDSNESDRIKRLVPRFHPEVNRYWMCDEGRLSYRKLYETPRILEAQAPAGTSVAWEDATTRAADILKNAAAARRLGVLFSPRLTLEEMGAWRAVLELLGEARYGVHLLVRGEDDDLLIRADKGANSRGAGWIFGEGAGEEAIVRGAASGEFDALLILGDPLDGSDGPDLPDAARQQVRDLVFVGPFAAGAAERATVMLPVASWGETDGTLVNFQGRVQAVHRAILPRGEARPGWRAAADVAAAAGAELPAWSSAEEVFAFLAERVRELAGVDVNEIGLLGVPVEEGAAAGA